MSIALTPDDPAFVDVQQLRMEAGWTEVGKGLTKILLGHCYIIGGVVASVALVGLVILNLSEKPANDKAVNLAFEFVCYLGLALLGVGVLTGYGMIIVGQWKCLKHAPERHGAKWLMFSCITCLLMGPALNTTSSLGGVRSSPNFRQGPRGLKVPEFSESTRYFHLASSGISFLSLTLFVAFLRTIARCFGDTGRHTHATIYLVYVVLLSGGTLLMIAGMLDVVAHPEYLLVLGGGWVVSGVWFLVLVLSLRLCIGESLHLLEVARHIDFGKQA